ncbi:MAG: hypothetical protein R3C99_19380 [Pirellulaceae bacterium]
MGSAVFQLTIAGDGAIDVVWSPENPDILIGVDNAQRVTALLSM